MKQSFKKMLIIFYGILSFCFVCIPLYSLGIMRWGEWRVLNSEEKVLYLSGMIDGVEWYSELTKGAFHSEGKELPVGLHLDDVIPVGSGIKLRKLVDVLDEFYLDPLNENVPVNMAVSFYARTIKGYPEDVLKMNLEAARKYGKEPLRKLEEKL